MSDPVAGAVGGSLSALLSPPLIALFLGLAIIAVLLRRGGGGGFSFRGKVKAKPLLTATERRFLYQLEDAVPECRVYVQVSMGALMRAVKGSDQRELMSVRNRFSSKIVDFVVEDHEGVVVALVELDDLSHHAGRDAQRDSMTAAAGYRTVRFRAGRVPAVAGIRADVLNLSVQ